MLQIFLFLHEIDSFISLIKDLLGLQLPFLLFVEVHMLNIWS